MAGPYQVFPQAGAAMVNPYDAQIEALRRQQTVAQAQRQPMYSPEQVQDRQWANDRDYQLGMLAQLSGDESMGQVGGQVFKQALAQRQPRVTDKGMSDQISGKFTYDPDYLRQRDDAQVDALESRRSAWEGQNLLATQGRRDRETEQRRREQFDASEHAKDRAARAGAGTQAHYTHTAYTPQGANVLTNPNGLDYTVTVGPNGAPVYSVYQGAKIPKATQEKNIAGATEVAANLGTAQRLLATVEQNPGAFGFTGRTLQATPGPLKGLVAAATFTTDAERQAQADVMRDAAVQINAIYGAAQSLGEEKRARTWVPDQSDDLAGLIVKLRSAVAWGKEAQQRYGPGVLDAVQQRGAAGIMPSPGILPGQGRPGAAPAAPAGNGGWSARMKPGG